MAIERWKPVTLGIGLDAARKGVQVDASKAWEQIDELLDEGFNRAALASRLGMKTPKLQFCRSRMTQANVDRVDTFYRAIMVGGRSFIIGRNSGSTKCSKTQEQNKRRPDDEQD
jgi:hypothetical protein